jgi:hypothetical protein
VVPGPDGLDFFAGMQVGIIRHPALFQNPVYSAQHPGRIRTHPLHHQFHRIGFTILAARAVNGRLSLLALAPSPAAFTAPDLCSDCAP